MDGRSDSELMVDVAAGDRNAFDLLFVRYCDLLRSRIRRIVRDEETAEDVLQDVFLRVWTASASWSGSGSVQAWLSRIASNAALNSLRSHRRRRELPLRGGADEHHGDEERHPVIRELESTLPGPESLYERKELSGTVRRLIDELPESKREVLELIYGGDMSVREASVFLGVSDGTIKSRLYYGRRSIGKRIRDLLEWEE